MVDFRILFGYCEIVQQKFNDKRISYLYTIKKLSTRQIAEIYHCSKSTIATHLIKSRIRLRSHSESKKLHPNPDKYKISYNKLFNLYYGQKLSAYQIAKIYNCSPSGIFYRLKRENIARRNLSESVSLTNPTRLLNIAMANVRYLKKDFNRPLEDRAYLIGFRLGDLHVSKKPHGITVVVQCWSTKPEQIILIKELFQSFGHISLHKRINHGKEHTGITCSLNQSFEFLLDDSDTIPAWILKKKKLFLSFVAGYIDAEGNFRIDRNWGRFSLSSYQKNIIQQIHQGFNKYGIICPKPYISFYAGYTDKRGITNRQDLWTLRVNKQSSILKMYLLLSTYMKHIKRLRDFKTSYQTAHRLAS